MRWLSTTTGGAPGCSSRSSGNRPRTADAPKSLKSEADAIIGVMNALVSQGTFSERFLRRERVITHPADRVESRGLLTQSLPGRGTTPASVRRASPHGCFTHPMRTTRSDSGNASGRKTTA